MSKSFTVKVKKRLFEVRGLGKTQFGQHTKAGVRASKRIEKAMRPLMRSLLRSDFDQHDLELMLQQSVHFHMVFGRLGIVHKDKRGRRGK